MAEERQRRVNALFHAALERESQTRQPYLEVACGGDAELRQQVELLLAKQEEVSSFLETPAVGYAMFTRTASVDSPPEQFGAYRILSLLGAGGMGKVFRAHDSKLGRDVALIGRMSASPAIDKPVPLAVENVTIYSTTDKRGYL